MKSKFVIGGLVALIGIAIIPVVAIPFFNPKIYHDIQKVSRKGIVQEEVQPGNMRVWSDPFSEKKR